MKALKKPTVGILMATLMFSNMQLYPVYGNELDSSAGDVNEQRVEHNDKNIRYQNNRSKQNNIIHIEDINLKKAINRALGRNNELASDITQSELESIEQIYAYNENISSLSGLEYCINLKYIGMSYNNISDISPISELTNLRDIRLDNNKIKNIDKLSNLKNLNTIYLDDNDFSDISSLSNLSNLSWINLSNNKIKDITPLSNLSKLETVFLYGNEISDVKLEGLPNLNILDLSDNKIVNLSLKNLPKLDSAGLYGLKLDGNKEIKTVEMVNIPYISSLDLSNRKIIDITLNNMVGLYDLNLSNNNISSLSGINLSDAEGLYNINLSGNNITKISSLVNTSAKVLLLNNNKIDDISEISKLPNLGWLYLNNNKIDNISEISKLYNLTYLDIANNKINDINALSKLSDLWFLNISNNEISNVNPLSSLKKLDQINLSDNKISDITSLKNLPYNQYSDYIYLDRNYIDLNDIKNKDVITTLEKKGFKVTYTGQKNQINESPEVPPIQKPIELDDIKGHWAEKTIKSFIDKEFINGYQDNTFKPNNDITRAEFVKIVNKVFGFTQKGTVTFNDVKSTDWFYNEIAIAQKADYINGKSATTFAPNDKITRQEVAVILTNIKNNKDTNYDKINKFTDGYKTSSWAKSSVEGAIEAGYLSGNDKGLLNPTSNITRAEVVTMLSRVK